MVPAVCRSLICTLLLAFSTPVSALTTISVPGGWYGEARVDGQYAVLVTGSHIQTHAGVVPLPDATNVLFVRVTPNGVFRIAGQDHKGRGNLEWFEGTWRLVGDSYGVNPVLYDLGGVLHQGAPRFGSQGFRYAATDGRIFTGDETYADPSRRIWEYTTYGDVTIGQGESGCIALRSSKRFVIEPGDCRNVRVTRDGDRLAVTMVKQLEGRTVLLWLTADELAGFPPEGGIVNPPPPPPPLPPSPPPPPQDCSAGWTPRMPNRVDVVQRLKEQFPGEWEAMNTAGDLAFIKRLAWTLHQEDPAWGLNGKRGTDTLSEDVLVYLNPTVDNAGRPGVEGVDFVIAHGAPSAHPGWLNVTCPVNQGGAGAKWIQPEPVDGVPPPPPPPDDNPLKARIAELERNIEQLLIVNQQLVDHDEAVSADRDAIAAELATVRAELDALKSRPAPTCEAKVPGWLRAFGVRVGCTIKEP